MPDYDDVSFSPPAPVARVTLRRPGSNATVSDVVMLIDSGADVTLLPRSSVDLLDIKANPEETCQLMSFDGSTTISQVVQVDLIFLRKTFKGRFLLIDGKTGILGRDVLNHIALLLDGPYLTWKEKESE